MYSLVVFSLSVFSLTVFSLVVLNACLQDSCGDPQGELQMLLNSINMRNQQLNLDKHTVLAKRHVNIMCA